MITSAIGYILCVAHRAFQAITAPIRNRPSSVKAALDAYALIYQKSVEASANRDKRGMGEIQPSLKASLNARLRAELRVGR